jgi:hypothetical protein
VLDCYFETIYCIDSRMSHVKTEMFLFSCLYQWSCCIHLFNHKPFGRITVIVSRVVLCHVDKHGWLLCVIYKHCSVYPPNYTPTWMYQEHLVTCCKIIIIISSSSSSISLFIYLLCVHQIQKWLEAHWI